MSNIILLDDDIQLRGLFALVLEEAGHTVITASNSKDIIDLVTENKADLIITDLVMPEHEGIEGIFAVQRGIPTPIPIIAMSAYREYLRIVESVVAAVLLKPLQAESLVETVDEVLRKTR